MSDMPQWTDKLREIVVPLLITVLVGTGLIAATNFLLFESPAEYRNIQREEVEQATNPAALDSKKILEIFEVFKNNPTNAPGNKTGEIIIRLGQSVSEPLLSDFVYTASVWCMDTKRILSVDRGKIAGYTLVDSTFRQVQQDLDNFYDAEIRFLDQLLDNVVKSFDLTDDEKRLRLIQLDSANIAREQALNTVSSRLPQLVDTVLARVMQISQQSRDRAERVSSLQTRTILSAAIVGLAMLVIAVVIVSYFRAIRRQQSRPTPS